MELNIKESPTQINPLNRPQNLETLKLVGVIIIIAAFALFTTQSWKGDAGFPTNIHSDFTLHSYSTWVIADHISHGNFDFNWDYKSNSLLSRGRPILPYLIAAPLVILFGLFNGISYFVIICYFLLGIGMYLLGKKLELSTEASLFLSGAMLLSYTLIIEVNIEGGIHRLLTYALLPFLLICFFNKDKVKYVISLAVILAAIMLIHPLNGASYLVILLALLFFETLENKTINKEAYFAVILAIITAALLTLSFFGPLLIEQTTGAIIKPDYQVHGEKTLSEKTGSIPGAFIDRTFGTGETNGESYKVFGYLGISIILLAIIGILFTSNKLRIPFLILITFFYFTLSNPEWFPTILQAYHYARPLVMISFLLATMGAFAINKLTQTLQKTQIVKIVAIIALFAIVFIDLAPGITAMPYSSLAAFKNTFSQVVIPDRIISSQMWMSFAWSPFSSSNFIQTSLENSNPEYYSFIRGFSITNKETTFRNQLYLLDVFGYINPPNTIILTNATKVFSPNKIILIQDKNLTNSEKTFENILNYSEYEPNKIGILLARTPLPEANVDLLLVQAK